MGVPKYQYHPPIHSCSCGATPVSELTYVLVNLDTFSFRGLVDGKRTQMSYPDCLDKSDTDAIVVMHNGKIVFKRYFNGMQPQTRHMMMSVTKSLTGTVGAMLDPSIVEAFIAGGDRKALAAFASTGPMKGFSYKDQWWVTHNEHGAFAALGVYGQLLYIDPTANVVIVKQGSMDAAETDFANQNDFVAALAVAKFLMGH